MSHTAPSAKVIHGDCIEVMRDLPENSVDSIVTDPPYGLGFMGKKWDDLPPGKEWAEECLRVLKPGGHLLAFGGTRTWHRLAVAVEDAGFEMRDSIAWLYGSGFPKSHDVGKSTGATKWSGWGTALKPAFEPVVVARKPLVGTVAANVLEYGTGALNIDGCRIEGAEDSDRGNRRNASADDRGLTGAGTFAIRTRTVDEKPRHSGRWPANVALDENMADVLDEQSGNRPGAVSNGSKTKEGLTGTNTFKIHEREQKPGYADQGGASRFFKVAEADEYGAVSPFFPREFDAPFMYVAKAPKKERPVVDGVAHPTVKPLSLMRYLVRLVTPTGGTVLEPFAGSGATVEACLLEGFTVIAIEREAEYLPLIQQRVERNEAA